MTTFTRLSAESIKDETTQVSQILFDDMLVACIEYDTLNRVIIYIKDKDWYYVNGDNITVRKVVQALGYSQRPIVTWAKHGERYDVLDQLVINAPQNTIRIFTNPNKYLEYSEYDELDLESVF